MVPVIILGAGGHAKVLADILIRMSVKIIGFTEIDNTRVGKRLLGIPILGHDDVILGYNASEVALVNGLGSIGRTEKRKHIYAKYKAGGFSFAKVIDPNTIIANSATISEGVQIMAGAVIQPDSSIGENTIINTRASIDHDCIIGSHVHIAPGVTLSGGVTVGDGVHIGTGAIVIQGVRIGSNSMIGAGTLVLRDVMEGTRVVGIHGRGSV